MYITRLTIPDRFQTGSLNSQSLVDEINKYSKPKRSRQELHSFIVEWDFEEEDDAKDMRASLEDSLQADSIILDPSKPGYSGIFISIVEEEDAEEVLEDPDE